MKKRFFVVLCVVLSALVFAMPVMANAASSSNIQSDITHSTNNFQVQDKEMHDAIQMLDPYVNRLSDGTFQLNVPNNVKSKISDAVFNKIQQGMDCTNQLIKNGALGSRSDNSVYNLKFASSVNAALSGGVSQLVWYWWGYEIWMNHALTWNVTHVVNLAGAIAAVISAIPGAATIAAIVAGYCWAMSTIIDWNDKGNGVVMEFLAGNVTPFWISSQ